MTKEFMVMEPRRNWGYKMLQMRVANTGQMR